MFAVGCGGSAAPSQPAPVHVNGERARGDYVFETDASGTRFLVPVAVLAGQRGATFDVAASAGEQDNVLTNAPYRVIVTSATAFVPHSARIELLITGDPGRRVVLSWQETCGWTQEGKARVGGTGGQGSELLRSPAVNLVKLPAIRGGVPSCYLGATVAATAMTHRVRVAIIDY